jgi:hypothetical protein
LANVQFFLLLLFELGDFSFFFLIKNPHHFIHKLKNPLHDQQQCSHSSRPITILLNYCFSNFWLSVSIHFFRKAWNNSKKSNPKLRKPVTLEVGCAQLWSCKHAGLNVGKVTPRSECLVVLAKLVSRSASLLDFLGMYDRVVAGNSLSNALNWGDFSILY